MIVDEVSQIVFRAFLIGRVQIYCLLFSGSSFHMTRGPSKLLYEKSDSLARVYDISYSKRLKSGRLLGDFNW